MPRRKKSHFTRPSAAKRPPLTHFLCLPLVTQSSTPLLREFLKRARSAAEALPKSEPESGLGVSTHVPAGAFRPLGTLHLTLEVMSLTEPGMLKQATELLEKLDLESLLRRAGGAQDESHDSLGPDGDGSPLAVTLSLSRLSTFPPSQPQRASVLYASPHDSTSRLNEFCLAILAKFQEAGLLLEPAKQGTKSRKFTPHATIIKTGYADRASNALPAEVENRTSADGAAKTQGAVEPPTALQGSLKPSHGLKKRREGGRVFFDARPLLQSFQASEAALPIGDSAVSSSADMAVPIEIGCVQICEMRARKLGTEGRKDIDGLGEIYKVIAEKQILSYPKTQ